MHSTRHGERIGNKKRKVKVKTAPSTVEKSKTEKERNIPSTPLLKDPTPIQGNNHTPYILT